MTKRIAAVVLAAGSSSRMGRPKQLIKVEGQTLIRRTALTVLSSSADSLILTTAMGGIDFMAELHDLEWTRVEVENPQEGQSQSIRAGLKTVESLGDFDAILFTPCDLPLLSASHLNALIKIYRTGSWNIVASRYNEVLGAPMIVNCELWPELQELRGDMGARKLLASHSKTTTFIEWDDGKFDLDTPDDLDVLLRSKSLFQGFG